MASINLKEAMRVLNSDMTACILEMSNSAPSIFDKYELMRIHSYNLILEVLYKMKRDGHVDWEKEIRYY